MEVAATFSSRRTMYAKMLVGLFLLSISSQAGRDESIPGKDLPDDALANNKIKDCSKFHSSRDKATHPRHCVWMAIAALSLRFTARSWPCIRLRLAWLTAHRKLTTIRIECFSLLRLPVVSRKRQFPPLPRSQRCTLRCSRYAHNFKQGVKACCILLFLASI